MLHHRQDIKINRITGVHHGILDGIPAGMQPFKNRAKSMVTITIFFNDNRDRDAKHNFIFFHITDTDFSMSESRWQVR